MNILERIDSALDGSDYKKIIAEAATDDDLGIDYSQPTIVDMNDHFLRTDALRNTRGPCVGWEDYAAGRDYQPPMFYRSSTPVGPKDTGSAGIISPNDEYIKDEDGNKRPISVNPYSRKYGGIRPWAPGEVLLVLMHRKDEDNPDIKAAGLLYWVATKDEIKRVAIATHGHYDEDDINDAVQRGASAVFQELPDDKAVKGVRFTGFVGASMQQAMIAGVPAGYHDEYRKSRGLRLEILPLARSALKNAILGKSIDSQIAALDAMFSKIDENPGPHNPYGELAKDLYEIKDVLHRAMKSGDAKEIRQAIDTIEKDFDAIEEKEETFKTPGLATQGAIGRKPRDYGSMSAYKIANKLLLRQRKLAEIAIGMLEKGESVEDIITKANELWVAFKKTNPRKWHKDKDEGGDGGVEGGDKGNVSEAKVKPVSKKGIYTSPFEAKQEDLPGSPGSIGLLAIKKRLDEALKSGDIDKLKEFIDMSEREQQMIKSREEAKVRDITGTGLTTQNKETGKEVERTNFASKYVDKLHSPEIRETLGMVIARVSPYRDDRTERKEHAEAAALILDAIDDAINGYISASSEGSDTTATRRDLLNIARDLDSGLGEWKEEIEQLLDSVFGTIKINGKFSDIRIELNDLKKIAKQDLKLRASPESVTVQQYRLLLRLYGIDNYPERGTAEDPEIDEQGDKSRWAEAGYPAVASSGSGDINLWTDVYDRVNENGEHVQSVSTANISHQKKEAIRKFTAAAHNVQQSIGESLGVESVEYKILVEFNLLLCKMIVEDALRG